MIPRTHQQQVHDHVPGRLYGPLGDHPLGVHGYQTPASGVTGAELLQVALGVVGALDRRHALEGARLARGHRAVGGRQLGLEVL